MKHMSKNRDRSYTDGNKRCYVCKSCGLYIYEDLPVWQKKKTKQKNICSKCLGERKVAKETREEKLMYSPYMYSTYYKLGKSQGR